MAIIKKADMNREFTKVVARYMAQGMEFHPEAMNGHQGEDGKVALTDGKNVYMIYLHHEVEGADFTRILDVEKLTIERYDIQQGPWQIYWLGKGDVVEETVWYKINERREDVYVKSLEEAQRIHELHMARWRNSDGCRPNWEAVRYNREVFKKVVMAKTGRKRVNEENIVRVEKHTKCHYWKITTMFAGKQKDIYVKAQEVV